MTDTNGPQDTPGVKRPPRAAPLQPDNPGSGTTDDSATPDGDASGKRQKEQVENALENVREGYD